MLPNLVIHCSFWSYALCKNQDMRNCIFCVYFKYTHKYMYIRMGILTAAVRELSAPEGRTTH